MNQLAHRLKHSLSDRGNQVLRILVLLVGVAEYLFPTLQVISTRARNTPPGVKVRVLIARAGANPCARPPFITQSWNAVNELYQAGKPINEP